QAADVVAQINLIELGSRVYRHGSYSYTVYYHISVSGKSELVSGCTNLLVVRMYTLIATIADSDDYAVVEGFGGCRQGNEHIIIICLTGNTAGFGHVIQPNNDSILKPTRMLVHVLFQSSFRFSCFVINVLFVDRISVRSGVRDVRNHIVTHVQDSAHGIPGLSHIRQ